MSPVFFAASLWLMSSTCGVAAHRGEQPAPPALGNFSATQSTYDFNAAAGQTVNYVSTVPLPLVETLTIANERGKIIRTLVKAIRRAPGTYTDVWDGRDDRGRLLPDGPYFYVITVQKGSETFRWDLSQTARSELDGVVNLTITGQFDPYENGPLVFTYDFPSSVRTSLQVSAVPNFTDCAHPSTVAVCLTDWDWTPPGRYTFIWAGTDSSGVSLFNKQWAYLFYRTSTWPQNAVLLYGTKPTLSGAAFAPTIFRPGSGVQTLEFDLALPGGQTAAVAVQYLNQASRSVLRTIRLSEQSGGRRKITWDGMADNGMMVAPGAYTARITVADSIGNVATLDAVTTVIH